MDSETEKRRLERQIARYEELARELPGGSSHQTILDLIENLRQEVRALDASRLIGRPD
jgi:hypothetical protein